MNLVLTKSFETVVGQIDPVDDGKRWIHEGFRQVPSEYREYGFARRVTRMAAPPSRGLILHADRIGTTKDENAGRIFKVGRAAQ